ncbi:hypothetical protein LT493_25120 [Streptomyces tricolor]|nr:hypothetical protein [Streptomyces tricolor]
MARVARSQRTTAPRSRAPDHRCALTASARGCRDPLCTPSHGGHPGLVDADFLARMKDGALLVERRARSPSWTPRALLDEALERGPGSPPPWT